MIKKFLLAIMIALPMSVFAQKFGTVNTAELMEFLGENAHGISSRNEDRTGADDCCF